MQPPYKTVAVVGNSPCEKGLGKGAEIDAFDLVIRFNSGAVPDEHQNDYGSKTSIVVCNLDTFPKALERKNTLSGVLITGIQLDRQNPDIPALLELTAMVFLSARYPNKRFLS